MTNWHHFFQGSIRASFMGAVGALSCFYAGIHFKQALTVVGFQMLGGAGHYMYDHFKEIWPDDDQGT